MRGLDLKTSSPLTLDGQWEWYPGELLTRQQIQSEDHEARGIQVPGDWGKALKSNSNTSHGVGTYRLRILMDPLEQPIAFWLKDIQASSEVEINGEVLGGAGRVALTASEYVPRNASYKVPYSEKGKTEIELLIRVANFDSPFSGGIKRSVRFGSQAAIDSMSQFSIGFQFMIVLFMLLHGLYTCIVYLYRPKDRLLFVTGLIYFLVGLAIFSGHDKLLQLWLPVNYTWGIKIRTIVLLWQNLFVLLFFRKFAGAPPRSKGLQAYIAVLTGMTAVLLVAPASVANSVLDFYLFLTLYLITYIWFIWTAGTMAFKKHNDKDVFLLLLTAASIMSNLAWSIAESFAELTSVYYPIDLTVAVTVFSTYWFKKYLRNSDEIVELYEQLKAADKMKDQFLANTSHELRTPLHGIMNITENIYAREKEKLEDDSRKEMELLGTISRRMSYLLDDLLDIARLQEHRINLQPGPLSVQSIVPGVLAMLKYMSEGKPVTVHMKIAETIPPVMADDKRFVQIMYNLLHNALKYTDEGTISVTAEVQDGHVEIRVSDTGVGMDDETQSRIFTPYVQGVHGISDGRGIGLGLSICKQLVELHGGTLSVDSELGRGSTFFFRLPLAGDSASPMTQRDRLSEREAAAAIQAQAGLKSDKNELDGGTVLDGIPPLLQDNPIRILAVDDDPINLNVLVGILSTEPYHITAAYSAQEVLDLLETQQWDLLIADVMMPRMSGYELTQRVRERYSVSELPVLLLTARSQPVDIYTGFLAGANDYVTKPADALELKYRVRSLVTLKQSIHDRMRIEAAYLQAQIQPHFLFNTLNSLIVLSEIDTEKMRRLGEAFTSFLRISFDYLNTGELVDIAHELELVEAYLYIERERFGDKLSVVWEVEPDILFSLPPLSIQPLVENAVKHGLLSRAAGGTVHVRVVRRGSDIFIEVRDNGIGMPPDKVVQLLNPGRQDKGGIGISNTNRRLIRLYGQGLSIDSKPGEGTTVSFVIPMGIGNVLE
ncbi:ATP-binding protein [Paenibacillus sp. GCM10027626]|uniref:hybrid sensor histidine kinase/response regulator n=1 Tax=Paenibacillus sp. GCM10027626 TaxID=3273411 RepID=UPI00363A1FBE